MRCVNHPTVETDFWCKFCRQPICQKCDLSEDEKQHICSKCMAKSAISDFGREEIARTEAQRELQDKAEEKKSRVHKTKYAIVILAVIIAPCRLYS